jgi:molecular chaperone HscA
MDLLEIFDPKAPPRPIGIDLGTTNSIVARVREEAPEVIADCNGAWLVPSAVHYERGGQAIVGTQALGLAAIDPEHTIVSVKRLMGRGADDAETKRLGTYDFVAPESEADGKTVRFRVRGRVLTPIEVSAEILRTLKKMAEDELSRVGGAVITVPAYFDDAQRQATKDAARLAGLDVLRLINEPTAAALAYGLEKKQNGLFAVYDLGGGTFDVTILRLDDGVFEVKSTGGDSQLGGDDMDRAIAEKLLEAMGAIAGAPVARELTRTALDAARRAKHALTDTDVVELELPKLGGGDVTVRLSRDELDALIVPVVAKTGLVVRRALRDAGLTAAELDGVILVGGSTRVPYVHRYVEELFGKPPLCDLDPEKVVALGAALQANLLAGTGSTDDVLLLDVLPLSLGLETMGGVVEKILPRNTTIPTGARQTFTTYADNQTGFDLHVVQGERELAEQCRSLARFTLKGIPPMPAGMARLEVSFSVDADGLLSVKARELTTGIEQVVEVKPSYGLSDEQVEEMLMEALDHGEEDLFARRLVEERVEAERVLHATKKALEIDADLLAEGERENIERATRELAEAMGGKAPAVIHARIELLDHATKAWAGRRMDRAVAKAIAGKNVNDVEGEVALAKGVETHLAEHARGRSGGVVRGGE